MATALCLSAGACGLPGTGSRPSYDDVLDKIGAWAFQTKLAMSTESKDPKDAELVAQVVKRIGAVDGADKGKQAQPWNVHVVDDEGEDAVAFPGGGVLVSTGMLRSVCGESSPSCDREGQLATVLGHELVHVIDGHYLDRLKKRTDLLQPLVLAIAANPATWDKDLDPKIKAGIFSTLGVTVGTVGVVPFARDQEMRADGHGLHLMACDGGYEPEDALNYMRSRIERGGSAWSMMHPSDEQRLQALEKELRVVETKCSTSGESRVAQPHAATPAEEVPSPARPEGT